MVSATSARPSAGRFGVPAKMTSSIFWRPHRAAAPGRRAPRPMASTTLDLPLPLGPTTTVTPGSSSSVVVSAKDLKPLRVRDFRNTRATQGTRPASGASPSRWIRRMPGSHQRRAESARAVRPGTAAEEGGAAAGP